jgi:uncharacterized FlaG/YvyC family protein
MIQSIKHQLPTLSPSLAMSGHESTSDTSKGPYSTDETLPMEDKTAHPNVQRDPTYYLLDTLGPTRTHLRFRIDEKTDHVVITVLRPDTGDIVREIPMKEMLPFTPMSDAIQAGQVIHAIA